MAEELEEQVLVEVEVEELVPGQEEKPQGLEDPQGRQRELLGRR